MMHSCRSRAKQRGRWVTKDLVSRMHYKKDIRLTKPVVDLSYEQDRGVLSGGFMCYFSEVSEAFEDRSGSAPCGGFCVYYGQQVYDYNADGLCKKFYELGLSYCGAIMFAGQLWLRGCVLHGPFHVGPTTTYPMTVTAYTYGPSSHLRRSAIIRINNCCIYCKWNLYRVMDSVNHVPNPSLRCHGVYRYAVHTFSMLVVLLMKSKLYCRVAKII